MNRYEPEESLIMKVQSGEYGWREYIRFHSKELVEEFEKWCSLTGFKPCEEESAILYLEHRDREFEEAMLRGDA